MNNTIKHKLEIIEQGIQWIGTYLDGNRARDSYQNLVGSRRRLKKKLDAISGNPAAAIYGESQVGKSYLISSLLSEKGKPFSILDHQNNLYNFIEHINPPGGGSESTSLVSRFSVKYKPINAVYPIKAVLLSPADIILVLCDSFYNDINLKNSESFTALSINQIDDKVKSLKNEFTSRGIIQKYLTEDEVLDIRDYFNNHFQKADRISSSIFFDEIPALIEKVDRNEWIKIFSILWNDHEIFNSLFDKLINEYDKLSFSKEVFLPIESVLYSHGTLLDVKRLHEIYNQNSGIEQKFNPITKVFISQNSRELEVNKSLLCALTAELVFSQSETLTDSKPFLREIDLLDFPGARSRMNVPIDGLEAKVIPDVLLRGKVAYLFNKYSETERINILMVCAKHEQVGQRIMPQLLNDWISNSIGDSPHKRDQFIAESKVSPLFIIGTFFNVNLAFNPLHDKMDGSGTPLQNRWNQRFKTTLEAEYIEIGTYSWFQNWTLKQPNFKNIFLLRDFEKSETPSLLFKGFNQNKIELEEIVIESYPNFRNELRKSFLEFEFVKNHFENPEESWEESATINKDGTQLIISKLNIVSEHVSAARLNKTKLEVDEIGNAILYEFNKHFRSNDRDEELLKAKEVAGDIEFSLATAFAADNIKRYGQLMKDLMIDESLVIDLLRKKVDSLHHREVVNLDIYSNYRMHVPVENEDNVDSYFEKLCKYYEKSSDERKADFRSELEAKKIDLNELIKGNSDLIKNNAQQLAEELVNYWFEYIRLSDKHAIQAILTDNNIIDELSDMYRKIFRKTNITNRIAVSIRQYVEGRNRTDLPYEIIADIASELLNRCIHTVGFDYFDNNDLFELQQANTQNNLGLVLEPLPPSSNSLEEVFTKIEKQTELMLANPQEMQSLSNYKSYLLWSRRLKIGFVSVCDIPNYDVKANDILGRIINDCRNIN
jgi:hypothetical protein